MVLSETERGDANIHGKSSILEKAARAALKFFIAISEIFQLKSETFHKSCEIFLQYF